MKTGDRVRLKSDCHYVPRNTEGTIVYIGDTYIGATWDNFSRGHDCSGVPDELDTSVPFPPKSGYFVAKKLVELCGNINPIEETWSQKLNTLFENKLKEKTI